MNAQANLKLIAAKRSTTHSPAQQRRTKLCKKLHEQMQLATAQAEGRVYAPAKFKTVTDAETGAKRSIEPVKKVKQWWWTDGDGKLSLSVRYGAKVLELAKGKNAIEIPSTDELVPTLALIQQAVEDGSLDAQIEAASNKLRSGFKKIKHPDNCATGVVITPDCCRYTAYKNWRHR